MRSKLLTSCLLAGIAVALVISAARREQQHVAPPFRAASSAAEVPPPSWAAQHVEPLSQSGTATHLAGLKAGPTSDAATRVRLVESYGKLPLSFEANQGQADSQVKFLSRGRGYTLFLTGDEAVLALRSASQESRVESRESKLENGNWKLETGKSKLENRNWKLETGNLPGFNRQSSIFNRQSLLPTSDSLLPTPDSLLPNPDPPAPSVLRLKLVGANAKAKVVGLEELPGKSNYFLGNDPRKWRTNVANYARVRYKDVYPGIDLVYYGNQRQLEYDFVVAPGGDPRMIALSINGAEKLEIDTRGDLVLHANAGDIRLHKPLVYQATTDKGPRTTDPAGNSPFTIHHSRLLNGGYVLAANNQVSFEVTGYDKTKPLIIDPVLTYSTYLGGSGDDFGYGIAVDSAGNAYVTGWTYSTDFPTANAFQASFGGWTDAFVTKLNAAGSALVYSTYLGGSGSDAGYAIAVDSAGSAYITGLTGSTDFPTANPLQASKAIGTDAFVTKVNAAGSALVYSTYLGASGNDYGSGIAVDSAGNAYVTGYTYSTDFPTANPLQASMAGDADAFVSKLNAGGSALVYSTYLGGNSDDYGSGIAVDSAGNTYVTGSTTSTDFPTANPLQAAYAGGNDDAFVTKLNAAGSALVYSTCLGGSGSDSATGIAVDSAGNAYVTGETNSTDFPTAKPIQASFAGYYDAFVTKLNAAGSALVYSTYLGGSDLDEGYGIAVDSAGNAYVTGYTYSSNFPSANPLQASNAGSSDAFVSKLNAAGSALVYSTYLGGSDGDWGKGIAVDLAGNAYVAARTSSTNFPTASPLQGANAGASDAFVAKISPADAPAVGLSPTGLSFGSQSLGTTSAAQNVTLHNWGSASLSIAGVSTSGDFAESDDCDGSVAGGGASCTISVTFVPTGTGTRTGTLAVADNAAGSPHTVDLSGTAINPIAALSATSLTFGNQPVGTTSDAQTVTLTNTGIGPLTITSIATSADFAETNTCGSSVIQGAQCTLSVSFTPTAGGARTGSVTIRDNAADSPQSISLIGVGVPPTITLSTTSLDFGSQNVGTSSAAQAVTLTNNGPGPLTINSVSASADFGQTNNCPGSLAASANCTISVTFTPTTGGTRTGAVTITDNASGSPHAVSLTGVGIPPTITLSPTSLTFGDQRVGTKSAAQTVTLTNDGPGPLKITSLSASGDFAQTNNCPSTLAASANCTINVTFTPTATGTRSGMVTINDNATGNPHVVSLGGTGVAPAVTLSPTGLSFPDQNVGITSAPQAVTLTNSGTATLNITSILATIPFVQTNGCGSTLGVGANCAISVTFTPTVTGTTYGVLLISDDATGSPQALNLTGTTPIIFGSQTVGTTSSSQTFTVTNIGTTAKVITGIAASSDFAQSNNCGSLAPGASCTVKVTFAPASLGLRTGTLSIVDNAPGSPHATTLTGTGVGAVAKLLRATMNFASQLLGTTSAGQTVTLTNTGNINLTFTSITASGDFAQTNTCGSSVAAGASCTITATFTPAALGTRTGTITVTDNAYAGSVQKIALTGVGVALGASPVRLLFPRQAVGTTSHPQAVTLRNGLSTPLALTGIKATGDFGQNNDCGGTISARGSCTVRVVFTPTASGIRNGFLSITNGADGRSSSVLLMGIALPRTRNGAKPISP